MNETETLNERLRAHMLGDQTGYGYPYACQCVQHVACVYISEEVLAIAILTETLFRGGVQPNRQREAKCLV
jgi:hypothetical protein